MSRREVEDLVEQFRVANVLALPSVKDMRAAIDNIGRQHPVPNDVVCQPVRIGNINAEWIKAPGASDEKVLLYFHGGGYVIGSLNSHRELIARLSRATGLSALAVDYRLAPEHPFPAAVDDAIAAYKWVLASGIDPNRIIIGGDSAGGGLAIATLISLRDAGEDLPACGVCISPWVDLEASGESYTLRAALDPMCHKQEILNLAKTYLAGQDPRTPLASPLHADLVGLPPLLIHVGEAETLYDDSARITKRAKEAGVEVVLKEWKDMPHVFQLFAPSFLETEQSISEIAEFIGIHLSGREGSLD
jgi:monoterpene epsilon-lactone hydrolase